MESGSDKKKEHREITFQVGWKKGKIEWNEGASKALPAPMNKPLKQLNAANEKHLQLIWLPAMSLPGWLLFPLLYALPVFCFIFTLVLIYGLRHG